MTIDEMREELAKSSYTADEAFEICREVANAWQDSNVGIVDSLDLIVRLVAQKELMLAAIPNIGEMINDILRQAGLYPYMEGDDRWTNGLALEAMRLPSLENIALHLEQMKVFGMLVSGKSVILSAPTSFGKSLLVDALISSRRPSCAVIVVPTLALLDEYRKRLAKRFPQYNIISQEYQAPIGSLNIYIGTQERIAAREILEKVNLFVIDEFYKLDLERGDDRALALNLVMARYAKSADQIYLLGPSIDSVSRNRNFPKKIEFYKTQFSPVAADIIDLTDKGPNVASLLEVLKSVDGEPTLVYVRSPQSASRLASELIPRISYGDDDLEEFGDWLAEGFHPEWMVANSVRNGIGIHHGRVPRSVGQYSINLFNKVKLPILICTSTLIEGVNTAAKNVVIYDKYISTKKLDRFTYDNIKGRAGRMFQHYVGRIFIFSPPPDAGSFEVDIPLFSGFERASDEMIMHVPPENLGPTARQKREQLVRTSSLPADVLQRWSRFGIDALNSLRDEIDIALSVDEDAEFVWSGFGDYKELEGAFALAWKHLQFEKHGMFSPQQAAYFANTLRSSNSLREYFEKFVRERGLAAQESIDRCFNFLRGAEYTFPELLTAVAEVINCVREGSVDYSYFTRSLQNWFLPGNLRTLEEFGVPLPVIQRLGTRLPEENPDDAVGLIRRLVSQRHESLSPLEVDILSANLN